jgi:hypothetical protein
LTFLRQPRSETTLRSDADDADHALWKPGVAQRLIGPHFGAAVSNHNHGFGA